MAKVPFREQLALHLKDVGTFDMESDSEGYPTIHWLIARSMLADFKEYDRMMLLASYAKQVKNSLQGAFDILESLGINHYRSIETGKKNIRYITVNPDYRDAKNRDYKRQTSRMVRNVKSYGNNVIKNNPELALEIRPEIRRLTNKLEATV